MSVQVKANMRAFGTLSDRDVIMSNKHSAIAIRYRSETVARAAFQTCQNRAASWFNLPTVGSSCCVQLCVAPHVSLHQQ